MEFKSLYWNHIKSHIIKRLLSGKFISFSKFVENLGGRNLIKFTLIIPIFTFSTSEFYIMHLLKYLKHSITFSIWSHFGLTISFFFFTFQKLCWIILNTFEGKSCNLYYVMLIHIFHAVPKTLLNYYNGMGCSHFGITIYFSYSNVFMNIANLSFYYEGTDCRNSISTDDIVNMDDFLCFYGL